MYSATISALHIYPIKSLGGVDISRAALADRGFRYDRRWMLVDEEGRFMSQRTHHRLALTQVHLSHDYLRVRGPGLGELAIPTTVPTADPILVQIWNDTCQAHPVGADADRWFSEFLRTTCRLVYMPDSTQRLVRAPYAQSPRDRVGFADSFPYLVISEASLQRINDKLIERGQRPVTMRRFRPNIVVTGCSAHAEDQWRHMRIGKAEFRAGKLCSRCVVTTVDPDTAQTDSEPLRTLGTYRRDGDKIVFGHKFVQAWTEHSQPGLRIRVGDSVDAC